MHQFPSWKQIAIPACCRISSIILATPLLYQKSPPKYPEEKIKWSSASHDAWRLSAVLLSMTDTNSYISFV